MKTVIFAVLLFIKSIIISYGQIVTVVDNEDQKPVADVAIVNESSTRFVYTDRAGKADISTFSESELICFQHFTYERICISKSETAKLGFSVSLAKKIFAFQDFVISANRWEQNRIEVPNRIATVLKPDILLQNPQTSADLVGLSGEVFIQKSQLGGGSPMIRGFATNRVLVVVDGVRMNNAIYREGNIQNIISLDASSIESGEVIFGPGAIVYGSDAIGGVMDFHTKKALLSTGDKPYIKTDASSRYSTANREKTNHLDINIGGKKTAFFSGITWSDFDHLKMGSYNNPGYLRPEYVITTNFRDSIISNPDPGRQVYSGYSQLNTINKLRFRITDGIDITIANHYSRLSDVPRYDRLIQYSSGKLRFAEWYYGPQVWMMNNLTAEIKSSNAFFDAAVVTLSQQSYRESRHDRKFDDMMKYEQYDRVGIATVNADFDKKFSDDKQTIYYGVEYFFNNVRSEAEQRNILTGEISPSVSRYPDGRNIYYGISLYAGYKNKLTKKLTLNTGARYNHVNLLSETDDNSLFNMPFDEISLSKGALTGSGGLVYRQDEHLQVNANISTGFRAPNLDDTGKLFEPAPGMVTVPNPGLRPEYVYNADLGFAKDFSTLIHLEATGYFSWLNNAITRHDFLFNGQDSILYNGTMSKVQALTNASWAKVYGIHLSITGNLAQYLKIKSMLTLTKGSEKGGIPLRHAAPAFGSTHLLFERDIIRADLYAAYNGPKKYEDLAPSERDKPYMYATDADGNPWSPAWFTLNLKMSVDLMKWAVLSGGVENILDNRYRPYSSGITAAGRNFIVSLRLII